MFRIVLLLSKFLIFVTVASLLLPASSVYGHGLGIDTIPSVDKKLIKNKLRLQQLITKQKKIQKMLHFLLVCFMRIK